MGASLALAGVSALHAPADRKVFPYVKAPELDRPGEPLFFATAMPLGGIATGLLVESHMGRPTEDRGQSRSSRQSRCHRPPSRQASVLGLYDPDRSQVVRNVGDVQTWANFAAMLSTADGDAAEAAAVAGLRILTGTVTSPTLAAQLARTAAPAYPQAKWHQWEPVSRDAARRATRLRVRPSAGHTVPVRRGRPRACSLDADFLGAGRWYVRYVRDYVQRSPRRRQR